MKEMGQFCKAYELREYRSFKGWTENKANARLEKQQVDVNEVEKPRELNDDDILYLQENFIVTDGIFLNQNIIFDQVSPAWIDFCKSELQFEVPMYETAASKQ